MYAASQQFIYEHDIETGEQIMIDQININNFRCFQKLEVPNLKKANLLVGQNSSGKSAFLEAIFLSSSSAAANTAFQLRAIRRMGNQLIQPSDAQAYRGLWEDLFFDFKQDKKISIKIAGNPNSDSRNLSIEYASKQAQELPFGKQPPMSGVNLEQTNAMPQIEFKWKRNGYPEVVSKPRFTNTGMQIDATDVTYFPSIWYTPGGTETPDESAKRFSDLDKRGDGKLDMVKTAIFKEFPFIKNVSIQYHAGFPMLFAELDKKPRKMPVALLSDGINRLLGICLSLAYFAGGTVLIDQFEDGFHYKLLPSIWSSVYKLANEFKVQLFVSTHSKECMDALLPTMRGQEEDFCLLQASRTETGCDIKSLAGRYLESALEQEFEVR
jgi:predicted ATPase